MSLIGRKVEFGKLKKLYDANYVVKVQGPPSSGKSTLINHLLILNKITYIIINFHEINWQSITDTYLYFKGIFNIDIDDPDKDIVDLAYLFNKLVEHISVPIWIKKSEPLWFDNGFTLQSNTAKYLFWTFFNMLCNSKKVKSLYQ